MLVLSRKLQQQIRIGDGIVITILRIQGNTVRVGIEAPKETRVLRGELEVHPSEEAPSTPTPVEFEAGATAPERTDRLSSQSCHAFGLRELPTDRLQRIRAVLAAVERRRSAPACRVGHGD